MKIDIVTLFPEMFVGVLENSILKRAQGKGAVEIHLHNLRDWATDKHKTVDDTPYGGGAGMVLKVDVMDRCLEELQVGNEKSIKHTTNKGEKKRQFTDLSLRELTKSQKLPNVRKVLLTPQGKTFDQTMARELAQIDHIILICGHYEGFDQRIREYLVEEEISIGDYVLTGGEIPAMVVMDAVTRLLPGVIRAESHQNESFSLNIEQSPTLEIPNAKCQTNCKFPISNFQFPINSQSSISNFQTRKNQTRHPEPESPSGALQDIQDLELLNQTKPDQEFPIPNSQTNEEKSLYPESAGDVGNVDEKWLEYPQYTKPVEYKGWKVPEVLLSGHHGEIEKWRKEHVRKK